MRRKVLAAAVLVAALVAPVNAASAAASWPSLPCPSGALLPGQSETGPVEGVVSVPGVINCGVPEPGPQFAVAIFEIDDSTGFGFVHGNLLKYYASPEGPTRFKVEAARMDGKIFAAASVCLMTDEKTRLSCVHVTSDLVVTQISTEDPSVARPVKFLPPGSETSPSCGGCWRVT
jgi:hypothetical protein